MEALAEAFMSKLSFAASKWAGRGSVPVNALTGSKARSPPRMCSCFYSWFVPFRKRWDAEAAWGPEKKFWNAVASNFRVLPGQAACCSASVCCLGLAQRQQRIKERANARRRDKIPNKIARDFSFGPLVKIPSSPDGVRVGNGVSSRPDTRRHRSSGAKLWRTRKWSQKKLKQKLIRERERMNLLEFST